MPNAWSHAIAELRGNGLSKLGLISQAASCELVLLPWPVDIALGKFETSSPDVYGRTAKRQALTHSEGSNHMTPSARLIA
jgi:hypothetical protein